jgi:diphosphomevalonate decarboxylase
MSSSLDPNAARRELSPCQAIAHSNIALAKYWGKRDVAQNLPDVPSLSLTLAGLSTTTRVAFDADLDADELVLNGTPADADRKRKVTALLDRVRRAGRVEMFARVESSNDFPTASGLASSASGFAALALASLGAAGLAWPAAAVSDLARRSSVSAARSVFGGFVALEAGASHAEPLDVGSSARQLQMVIAVTDAGPKPVGSTEGMLQTQASSPYYASWREAAPRVYRELRNALLGGDFEQVGEAMEHSTLLMHASMLSARPALIYMNAATLSVIARVRELRRRGTFAYFTMDAGPHVKVLTQGSESAALARELELLPGVSRVIVTGVGGDARLVGVA